MRTLRQNKQAMKYSIDYGEQPVYVLDENGNKIVEFVDEEGNEYYKETGSYENVISIPEDFYANIAMSGGEAEAQEYGLSVGDYNAVIVSTKRELPLALGALIWLNSPVEFEDIGNTKPKETSADYKVIKVSESLNEVKYILKAIVK